MVDSEVERIADLMREAHHEVATAWLDTLTDSPPTPSECWAAVARAVIADRAAQPLVTGGPTLMEVASERDALRHLLDDAKTEAGMQEAWANDLQRRLDALATREPTETDIWKMSDTLQNPARGFVALWRCVRDALLTVQEPPTALSPADILSGAEEMLRRIAATACLGLDATEAAAIVAELDRLRAAAKEQ